MENKYEFRNMGQNLTCQLLINKIINIVTKHKINVDRLGDPGAGSHLAQRIN